MLRKLAIALSYFIALLYALSILLPVVLCLLQGCNGPGELDAFLPAFGLTPFGVVATVFSLRNAIQNIGKKHSPTWILWPFAILFVIVLACDVAFIMWIAYEAVVRGVH